MLFEEWKSESQSGKKKNGKLAPDPLTENIGQSNRKNWHEPGTDDAQRECSKGQ